MADNKKCSRGGHGGSVEIIEGNGVAEGGHGGRGGSPEFGRGGDGGGGKHFGSGYVRGGDGGDAGRPARPALGGLSSMCYMNSSFFLSLPGITDIYGIPKPGRGGDSYAAYVTHEGYEYCLNVLLDLIRSPIPNIINKPEIIDTIDELGIAAEVKTEQEWWELAVEKFSEETSKAMKHMKTCEAN